MVANYRGVRATKQEEEGYENFMSLAPFLNDIFTESFGTQGIVERGKRAPCLTTIITGHRY